MRGSFIVAALALELSRWVRTMPEAEVVPQVRIEWEERPGSDSLRRFQFGYGVVHQASHPSRKGVESARFRCLFVDGFSLLINFDVDGLLHPLFRRLLWPSRFSLFLSHAASFSQSSERLQSVLIFVDMLFTTFGTAARRGAVVKNLNHRQRADHYAPAQSPLSRILCGRCLLIGGGTAMTAWPRTKKAVAPWQGNDG